jgi:hypothetical protein
MEQHFDLTQKHADKKLKQVLFPSLSSLASLTISFVPHFTYFAIEMLIYMVFPELVQIGEI